MKNKKMLMAVAVAAAAMVMLAGCGKKDEGNATSAAPIAAGADRSCAAACAADSAALCTVARASTPRPRNTITTASPIAAGANRARPSASDEPRSSRNRRRRRSPLTA